LAAAAFGLTFVVRSLLKRIGLEESGPLAIAYVSSGFSFYGLLHLAFDRLFWKARPLRVLGIVKVPAVGGTWEGELRSSRSQYSKVHPVKLRIHQTWSTIRLTLDSEKSFSVSHMASIRTISADQFELQWEYRAEAKEPEEGEKFSHRGVTMLRFELNNHSVRPEMCGDYYTQHGRDTNGTIAIQKRRKADEST
jgi:hypothetical protein